MADNLPDPASREESYLAKAAGMDVTIPEKPESRVEQYLEAIAEGGGGGGGSYSAGTGIDIANNTISVDTDTIQEKLTAGTGIDITNNTISATGGGGPTVVQTTGTSTTDVMSQNATTSMVFKDPSTQEIVKIGKGSVAGDTRNVSIGYYATSGTGSASYTVAVGGQAYAPNQDAVALGAACSAQANGAVAIGRNATVYSSVTNGEAIGYSSKANSGHDYSVAIGAYASTTRAGEINIGTGANSYGYNSTTYRVLGGVHDPVDAHDAATKGYVDGLVGNIESALNAINNGGSN